MFAVAVAAPHTAAAATICPATHYGPHRYALGYGKTVALTFDDGPGRSTAQILQILSAAHVEATFFNLGMYEAQTPYRVRAEYTAGFALGDHTWNHQDMSWLDSASQAREIDRERAVQASITGVQSCLLRPPYGTYNSTTLALAQQRGMRVWLWSVDTEDWKAAGSSDPYWVHRIITRAEAGGAQQHPVILMHNQMGGNPATVAALPVIIKYYKSHGYRFVDMNGRTGHPVIGRITPTSGPTTRGTRITVTGHDFVGVRAVLFGAVRGRWIRVGSTGTLTVTAPPQAAGAVHVRVVTTFGTSPRTSADVFRYVP